jgi:hypothetical protein
MDKRSALVTAGGLTASFVAGIAAVSFDWGLVGASSATTASSASVSPKAQKPIIKHRTIVVHKKAKPSKAPSVGARTVTVPAPASATTVAPAPSHPVTSTGGSPTTGGDDDHEHGDD